MAQFAKLFANQIKVKQQAASSNLDSLRLAVFNLRLLSTQESVKISDVWYRNRNRLNLRFQSFSQ